MVKDLRRPAGKPLRQDIVVKRNVEVEQRPLAANNASTLVQPRPQADNLLGIIYRSIIKVRF
jgi:hypothetical protein